MLRELAKLYRGLLFRDGYLTDPETLRRMERNEAADAAKAAECGSGDGNRKAGSHYWRPRWIW